MRGRRDLSDYFAWNQGTTPAHAGKTPSHRFNGGDVADTSERFGLFWPGKKRAMRAAQTPTTATLRPDKENSKDWDTTKNVFIEGDNLEVLKILQKHYHGKIKMIYIDPPYNTGKDFVYPDNYKEGLQTYLEWSKQVNEDGKKLSSNSESEGRYLSLIHISEPTRQCCTSRMPSSA